MISLRLCYLVMLVKVNYHWFPSDFVTWISWLWEIITDFPQNCDVVMLAMGNYLWFPSDFAAWSCWLWKIFIDFPQTLSLGYAGYGKLSLISLRLCHSVMLVMGKYHWFSSEFVTWSYWLWEIIIDFPQTLSLGHVGYVNYHWFPSDCVAWSCLLLLIIIDFP